MTNDETIQRNTALFDYYNSATGNRVKKTAKMFDMRSEEAWYIIRDARKGIGIIPPKPTVFEPPPSFRKPAPKPPLVNTYTLDRIISG
jgi:hypothetical protein